MLRLQQRQRQAHADIDIEKIFSLLADRHSLNILKEAFFGFKASSSRYTDKISKKQFYLRLGRLRDAGFIEKRNSVYRTTTFGSLVCNAHIKTMDNMIANYWNLKAIDVIKSRDDFPIHEKDKVIEEIIENTSLKS